MGGYLSIFEEDLILKIEKGIFTEERLIDNRERFEKLKAEGKLDEDLPF